MLKKAIPGLLSLSLLFGAGCAAAPVPVTPENAPTEILKKAASLSSDSKGDEVLNVMQELINNTAKAYDWKMTYDQNIKSSNLSVQDGKLKAVDNTSQALDTRIAADEQVFEILAQKNNGQQMIGFMDAGPKGTTTVYGEFETGGVGAANSSIVLHSIDSVKDDGTYSDKDSLTDSLHHTVVFPIYPLVGASLILQPFVAPEYYNFELTKKGNDYTLHISVKDLDKYNEALNKYMKDTYGYDRTDLQGDGSFIADSYQTTGVDISIVMNEDGIISSVENSSHSIVTAKGEETDTYSTTDCSIKQTKEETQSFIEDLFKQIQDKTVQQGSTIKMP